MPGLAAHALLKRHTGSHVAAFTGSLVYTFSFFKMHHGFGHLQLVWTWMLPLSILLLERWTAKPALSTAVLWAAVVVLQSLASWYLAVMTAVVQAVAVLFAVPTWIRERQIYQFWHLALVTVLATAVVRPFARPYRVLEPSSSAGFTGRHSFGRRAHSSHFRVIEEHANGRWSLITCTTRLRTGAPSSTATAAPNRAVTDASSAS